MLAVFGLVPDAALVAVEDLGADLFAPYGREAVQKDAIFPDCFFHEIF
jgi:hypothetical protein